MHTPYAFRLVSLELLLEDLGFQWKLQRKHLQICSLSPSDATRTANNVKQRPTPPLPCINLCRRASICASIFVDSVRYTQTNTHTTTQQHVRACSEASTSPWFRPQTHAPFRSGVDRLELELSPTLTYCTDCSAVHVVSNP